MIGPKDKWQIELEKASKSGLVCLAEMFMRSDDRMEKLEWAKWAREMGRRRDLISRIDRFHADPLIYYQGDTFFNTGDIHSCIPATDSNTATRCIAQGGTPVEPYFATNRLIAHGWWRVNLTLYEELGVKRNFIVGVKADNLFNQVTDTAPCQADGTGCYPFDGPQSGSNQTASAYPNINWIYPNYSQSPLTFYFFAGIRM